MKTTTSNCLNCGLSSRRERRYKVSHLGKEIIKRLTEWHPERQLSNEDNVCNQCLIAVAKSFDEPEPAKRQVGHRRVCGWCGKSVLRLRSKALLLNTAERQIVEHKIFPQQLSEEAHICHACCTKARRHIQRQSVKDSSRDTDSVKQEPMQPQSGETVSQNSSEISTEVKWPPKNEIKLPNYRRTACSTAHCVYPGCSSRERLRVPKAMRVQILTKYKLYIPYSARTCSTHISLLHWDSNIIQQTEFLITFRPEHIEDMLNLQKKHYFLI